MNAAMVVWDAISGFLKAVNAILSVVPGLVWAVALSAALVHGWWVGGERDAAVREKNVIQAVYEQLTVKVIRQKQEAAALLKQLTEQVAHQQQQLNDAHRAQEKQDANNQSVIDRQAARLRALAAAAPGGQLRDPNAAGCGRGGAAAEGQGAAAADRSPGDRAEAGGLLSADLSGLLLRLTEEADAINRAYQSCRADAVNIRQTLESPP